MSRKRRYARSAERLVADAFRNYDALYQEVSEDESGWDGLVELKYDSHDIDSPHTHPKRFFVQVKSTTSPHPTAQVTLSNSLRSCRNDDPWFIVLVQETNSGTRVFIRHYWKEIMDDTLQKVWALKQKGIKINRKKHSLSFSGFEIAEGNIAEHMINTVKSFGHDYRAEKRRIFETSGFENGCGIGTFILHNSKISFLEKAFLGIPVKVPVESFGFRRERFGIMEAIESISHNDVEIKISPIDPPPTSIRISSKDESESVVLTGSYFTNSQINFENDNQKIRLHAEFMQILITRHADYEFSLALQFDEPVRIETIHKYTFCRHLLETDGLCWEAKNSNGGSLRGTSFANPSAAQWTKRYNIAKIIKKICDENPLYSFNPSLYDFFRDQRGGLFEALTGQNTLLVESDVYDPPFPSETKKLFYFVSLDILNYTFLVTVQRDVCAVDLSHTKRKAYMGAPVFLKGRMFIAKSSDAKTIYKYCIGELDEYSFSIGDIYCHIA